MKTKNKAVIPFKLLAGIIYFLLFCAVVLTICTSRKGLSSISKKYIDNINIEESSYFENYMDYGFTEQMCKELLMSDSVKKIAARVMTERLNAIFNYSEKYTVTLSECMQAVQDKLIAINEQYELELSYEDISVLTSYTCDVSGITSMFVYDSPAAYRKSLLSVTQEDRENYRRYDNALQALSKVASLKFCLLLFVMYIICVIIACILMEEEEKIPGLVCDTVIYSSVFAFAVSLAAYFAYMERSPIVRVISGVAAVTGVSGILLGIIVFVCISKNWRKRT